MSHIVYKLIKHADGWAYSVGDTISETFLNHGDARAAAESAAHHHVLAGNTIGISFEDANGHWHEELSDGSDRPVVEVEG
jgi:hypothetical protein